MIDIFSNIPALQYQSNTACFDTILDFKRTIIHDRDGDHLKMSEFIKDSRTNIILKYIYLTLTSDFEIKVNVFENPLS